MMICLELCYKLSSRDPGRLGWEVQCLEFLSLNKVNENSFDIRFFKTVKI